MKPTLFLCLTIVGCLAGFSPDVTRAVQPNILLIVADDLGYGDVGFLGCKEIPTPSLDALAADGVVFSAGYASHPYCSPSRAGLLTGRYQQRFGHECNPEPDVSVQEEDAPGLPLEEITLADSLRQNGYVTGAIGKWHLGDAKAYWPNRRGFQEWFGFSAGGLSYWGTLGKKPVALGVHRGDVPVPADQLTHLTDDFSTEAVEFVDRHRDQPFFLYLAYNAPHAPDHATKAHLEKTKHIEYGGRAVYGAMVAGMDQGIGRVIQQLKTAGIYENTLVIFYSDNGGRISHARNFPLRGHKGMLFEGGIRVPFLMSWPKSIPGGRTIDAPVSALDIFPTVAAASNASIEHQDVLDGMNLLPHLTQEKTSLPSRTLHWRYAMGDGTYGYAVREGDMKLVKSAYKGKSLLFDLRHDPWERQDLSQERPQTVQRLSKLIRQWDQHNKSPAWLDEHGPHVRQEEEERQKIVDAASRGER